MVRTRGQPWRPDYDYYASNAFDADSINGGFFLVVLSKGKLQRSLDGWPAPVVSRWIGHMFDVTRLGVAAIPLWARERAAGRRLDGLSCLLALKGVIKLMLSFFDPVCQEPRILWGVRSRSLAFLFPNTQQLRVKSHQPIPAGHVVMDICLSGLGNFGHTF